jgi:Ca2+-dependent lipid-binding protein
MVRCRRCNCFYGGGRKWPSPQEEGSHPKPFFFDTRTSANNNKTGDGIGKSDPYVKLELVKDGFGPFDKSFGKQESSHKSNTVNPEYNETFSWSATPDDISGLVLHAIVMDDDIGLDDTLGKCSIKLADIDGNLANFCHVEKKIDNKWFSRDAKIHLKIKFES